MHDLPDSRIVRFIKKHHVLTLATSFNEETWCASCFYSYLEDENCLVFISNLDTKHIQLASHNFFVAGCIALETKVVGKIQGIQLQGLISRPQGELLEKARKSYMLRFPMAALMETHLWTIDLTLLKFTDNTLGFGKKLIWTKELQF